jgi:hypothetical protein
MSVPGRSLTIPLLGVEARNPCAAPNSEFQATGATTLSVQGSFATGSRWQEDWQCPLCRPMQSIGGSAIGDYWLDNVAQDVLSVSMR